ncbi:unnamed protein product, partial [Phaeothamnion confervicola]
MSGTPQDDDLPSPDSQSEHAAAEGHALSAGSNWEARMTEGGQIFYVNHVTKTTSWTPPPADAGVTSAISHPAVVAAEEKEMEKEAKGAAHPRAAADATHNPGGRNQFNARFVRQFLAPVTGARAKSASTLERKKLEDYDTQECNLGVPNLQAILRGPDDMDAPDRGFWTYRWPDSWGPTVVTSVTVDKERIIAMTAADEYPTNPMLVKSAPLRYFQSIRMDRRRVLPYHGIFGFIK